MSKKVHKLVKKVRLRSILLLVRGVLFVSTGFFILLGVFGYFVCCMLCLFCSKAITNPQSLDEIQKRRSQQHGNAFNAQIWHDSKLYLL